MESANKVLIVESKSIDGAYLKLLLSKKGMQADVVSHVPDVMNSLESKNYGVVFVSRQVADADGLEAIKRIKQWENKSGHRIFVVGMASSNIAEEKKNMYSAGVDYCINKPIYVPQLDEVISQFQMGSFSVA